MALAAIAFVVAVPPAKAATRQTWASCATGTPEESLAACSRIISRPKQETRQSLAKAYTGRGYAHYRQQDYQAAVADYTKAIALDPRFATAYINRGVAYRKLDRLKLAIADYSKAIRLKPDSVVAYNARGIVYRHLGQFDKAIADYSKAIRLKPDYAEAYNSRAFAYIAKGDIEKAIADYQTLIGMGRELVRSNYGVGFAYEQLGETDLAIAFYRRALASPGGNSAAEREAKDLARQHLEALASANAAAEPPGIAQGDDGRPADVRQQEPPGACAEYRLTGDVSFCVPKGWVPTASGKGANAADRYQFEAPDGRTGLFADWQYPEGDPKDDFDTVSSAAVTVNGLKAMRYVSVIRGPNSTLHHTLVVFDRPDAKGRRLTFMFETVEAAAADMQPIFETIISSIAVGGASARVADNATAPANPKPPQADDRHKVLFAGDGLGDTWEPRLETKRRASFEDVAKFENGRLLVDVPNETSWGQVGLTSKRPIWLDQFGPGAEKRLTFSLDPQETTGFAVALSTEKEHKTFVVKWVRIASEGKALLQVFVDFGLACNPDWPTHAKPVWEQQVADTAPGEVVLSLRPGKVVLSGDGLPEHEEAWPQLTPDAGIWLHAYSFPESYDGPARMALKKIELEDTVLKSVVPPKPVAGVEPLPVSTLFGSAQQADWQMTPWEAGDEPDDLCTLDDNGFSVLHGPTDGSHSDACDLHSRSEIVTLDDRLDNAVYELSAQFDPRSTSSFRIVLPTAERGNQRWVKSLFTREILLIRSPDEPARMVLDCADQGQRDVSPDWLAGSWNGRFTITIGKDWMRCALDGGPAVRVNTSPASSFYIYVVAPDFHYKGTDPRLRLTRLTGQWALLRPMTAAERWRYLDDDGFDAKAFVDDLASDLSALQ